MTVPVAAPGITKEQFEMLNGKLDKILKLITPVITVSKEMQAEAEEKDKKTARKKAPRQDKKLEPTTEKLKAAKTTKKGKVGKKSA
jgi:hypothetical protein